MLPTPVSTAIQHVVLRHPIVTTPGCAKLLHDAPDNVWPYLTRHVHGDWGQVDPEDWKLNDASARAVNTNPAQYGRVLSVYWHAGTKFWIITDFAGPDTITTLLLPSEY